MDRGEFLRYAYESVNADLKFSETKNTFLTTFNLAIIGATTALLFDSDKNINIPSKGWLVAFLITILFATLLSISSFIPLNKIGCLFKSKQVTDCKFMFYKHNYSKYEGDYDKFINDINKCFNQANITPAEKQLSIQIVDLSGIAYSKFVMFTIALVVEMFSFPMLVVAVCV